MGGNRFGQCFTLTSFGESHGKAIGGVIDGCPAGLKLDFERIKRDMEARKPGQSKYTTQRKEADEIEWMSGLLDGVTTGAPIGFLIQNMNAKSKDYEALKGKIRPGHGDYTYLKKYGVVDTRGGGRASARETAIRVVGGAVAKQLLEHLSGTTVLAFVSQIGDVIPNCENPNPSIVQQNPFHMPDLKAVPKAQALIDSLRKEGDSIGAKVTVIVSQAQVGLGEPVYERLDANLAKALMSINAAKSVEIGDGVACITQKGSYHRDEIDERGFLSNHSGGILAGISTGQDIIAHVAFKPTSSILKSAKSIDNDGKKISLEVKGRHDPCVGIRAVAVVEAMVALVLADHTLMVYGNKSLAIDT